MIILGYHRADTVIGSFCPTAGAIVINGMLENGHCHFLGSHQERPLLCGLSVMRRFGYCRPRIVGRRRGRGERAHKIGLDRGQKVVLV